MAFQLTPSRATRINLALAFAWTALALALLPRHGHFLEDEAVAWQGALEVLHNHRLAGYGPYISATSPVLYVPGGALFDLLSMAFLWTHHPLAGSFWVVGLAGLGLVLFDRAMARLDLAPGARVAAMVLYAFGIWHARGSDRMWAANSFSVLSPLLLFAAARAATEPRWWAAAFAGVGAGLCLQPHLSGALAIGMVGLLILPSLAKLAPQQLWLLGGFALLGFGLTYLPYLFEDAAQGFANTLHLGAGRTGSHLAIGRSFATFVQFSSQSDVFRPERFRPLGFWRENLGTLTFYLAVPLLVIGALCRSPIRLLAFVGPALVPAFFAATGRDYMTHYVAAGGPFYVLPAAVALDALWQTRARSLVAGYLAAFLALGVADLRAEYSPEVPEWQLDDQIAIAGALAEQTFGAHLVPESQLASQGRIYEWLAKDVLHRPLSMSGDTPCGIFATEAEARRLSAAPAFRGRHWVVCGEPGAR